MRRWAEDNNAKITEAILQLKTDPAAGLKKLQQLAAEAASHDRADAEVMQRLADSHRHLAG